NWTKNYGKNSGMSRSETRAARKLKTPDEIMKLSNDRCIVYMNNEYASEDYKTDITMHRFYQYISDGENTEKNMYEWGTMEHAVGEITLMSSGYSGRLDSLPKTDEKWVMLDDEDIEKMLKGCRIRK
ncbi:MAG: hypothetical protein K6B68_01590, partial [Eubacterium sp.]|nr:hypothetical protein [Eubacterium sp.]